MKRNILINIRKNLNLSQEEVAEKSRISRSYYGLIENGLRNPSYSIANDIAMVFNQNVEQIFEDELFFANKCYIKKQIDNE